LDVFEQNYVKKFEALNLKMSFLITPQTPVERIRKIDKLTNGFVYIVSSYAITGSTTGISKEQIAYFERVKAMKLKNPQLIGFGISDKSSFNTACEFSNGAIIGSAYIKALTKANTEGADLKKVTQDFVRAVL
jgi:tryptophan synthase alpha chain